MNKLLGTILLSSAMAPVAGCATSGNHVPSGGNITQVEVSERRYVAMSDRDIANAHAACPGLRGDTMAAARLIANGLPTQFNRQEACTKAGYVR